MKQYTRGKYKARKASNKPRRTNKGREWSKLAIFLIGVTLGANVGFILALVLWMNDYTTITVKKSLCAGIGFFCELKRIGKGEFLEYLMNNSKEYQKSLKLQENLKFK